MERLRSSFGLWSPVKSKLFGILSERFSSGFSLSCLVGVRPTRFGSVESICWSFWEEGEVSGRAVVMLSYSVFEFSFWGVWGFLLEVFSAVSF